jgi:UDP-glucose 4-epimerase
MNVLVTGGAGFIGSHIVDLLVEKGCTVSIADNLSTGRSENINPGAKFYNIDVRDPGLKEIVAREKPTAIIHLAAQVDVQCSLQDPHNDAEINILGTVNLLDACAGSGIGKVIYASSAAVYGSPVYMPVDERHPVAPQSPYGLSKYTAEQYLRLYRDMHGISFTVLRFANVYGPRQDATGEGGVVAIFIDKLAKEVKPAIFGDGEQTRDFIYVKDVAAASMAALQRGDGGTYNVSTGKGLTVNYLYQALKALSGSTMEPLYQAPRPGDIIHSTLSNARACVSLDWRPRYILMEGLRETVDFYR